MRGLGTSQRAVLRALVRHGSWPGGWIWENDSRTVRVLDSLVRRGLAEHRPVQGTYYGYYTPTDAGRELAGIRIGGTTK